jgi:mannitol operon transcriptional antiterminator
MEVFTARHRTLLKLLLGTEQPVGVAKLADTLGLTPRQVSYCLKQLAPWLAVHGGSLSLIPGVGVSLVCAPKQRQLLAGELEDKVGHRYVHSPDQRQHLLALLLAISDEPYILYQLQQMMAVSRSTVLADLETVEAWFETQRLVLERRRNYGIAVRGTEFDRRQALAAWFWGNTPWASAVVRVTHREGLVLLLDEGADAPAVVRHSRAILRRCDLSRTLRNVAEIEAGLGGRFTDDGALFLALVMAIQGDRVAAKHYLKFSAEQLRPLQQTALWPLLEKVGRRTGWQFGGEWPESETGYLAMYVLATPRNELWPGDPESLTLFDPLVQQLMQRVAGAFGIASLAHDATLRDGLILHIIPALYRQRFHLWLPPTSPPSADATMQQHRLASDLALAIRDYTGVMLPNDEIHNLAMLLEAAYIRERPTVIRQVLIVCPSGMATAQLLVARLKARFPHLGAFIVRSQRSVSQHDLASADLVITTVPLLDAVIPGMEVLQVHPLLLPEDINRITRWLNSRDRK